MGVHNLVAAYARVSTEEQVEQGLSIPGQKTRLMAYCRSQGWELYNFYVDDGYSGKDLERPAMRKLIEDASAGAFNIVLVLKLDRLSRRQKDVLYLLEDVFDPAGVGFKSVTESFDTTTPFGKAALGMMAVFAQLERETIVERSRMGKLEAAQKGRWHGGTIYGYDYKPGTYLLKIRESEAKIVREIFHLYLNRGQGIDAISQTLNGRGIPGPEGGHWLKQTVRYILANPTYAGYSRYKGNLYKGIQEPVVTPEEWHRAQELIQERRHKHYRRVSRQALLAGLIYCAECGARMRNKTVWQNHPREPKKITRYYVCYSQDGSARHMVRDPECRCGYKHMAEIDDRVIGQLYKFRFDEDLMQELISREMAGISSEHKNATRGLSQAKKELEQVKKALERWYSAFEKGVLEPEELTGRVKDLRSRRGRLEKSVREWEKKLQEDKQRAVSPQELLETVRDFGTIWQAAQEEEKRDIVLNLVKEVKVGKDNKVEVKYNLW